MSAPRILDLFCGQGGAGKGYSDAGFEVVGVDVAFQRRYPFLFYAADAVEALRELVLTGTFGGLTFSALHASPPCQVYSKTQRIRDNDHPDLIAPVRAWMKVSGLPYVIENVMGARDELIDPAMLCGAMFPGVRVYRHRLFETSWGRVVTPTHPPHTAAQTKMGRPVKDGEWIQPVGNFSGVALARDSMQMPWASREGLREAIPPAYTEYIGRQLMAEIQRKTGYSKSSA